MPFKFLESIESVQCATSGVMLQKKMLVIKENNVFMEKSKTEKLPLGCSYFHHQKIA